MNPLTRGLPLNYDEISRNLNLLDQVPSLKYYGARGNGVYDDTAALQLACSAGQTFFIPPTSTFYKVTAPIDVTAMAGSAILGAGDYSKIQGNFSGYIFDRPSQGVIDAARDFHRLNISNTHASGGGIHLDGTINNNITSCQIHGFHGVVFSSTPAFVGVGGNFTSLVKGCRLTWSGNTSGSIGLFMGGHATALSCDVTGFDDGIRIRSVQNTVIGMRMEVNNTALKVGEDLDGSDFPASVSSISGVNGEANRTFLYVRHAADCQFSCLAAQGSVNAPGGASQYGMRTTDDGITGCVFGPMSIGGDYDVAAFDIGRSLAGSNNIMQALVGANGGSGVVWQVNADTSGIAFQATNRANGAGSNVRTATALLSAVSGATVTATGLIPAKAFLLGVSTRVTTALGGGGGTTGYQVGDGTTANRFGVASAITLGTTTKNSDAVTDPTGWASAARNVVITAVGGNFNGTGAIRVNVDYIDNSAPTT
jgi:hypothetical protein